MSVGSRRYAAAQRTAVGSTPSRVKRLGAWIVIVPALSLFSFSVVASAAGFSSKPDVGKTATQVVQKHDDAKSGAVVVLGHGEKQVCWISKSQLVRVSAMYKTTTSSLQVGSNTYSLVTVYDANEHTLRTLLGGSAVDCKLVHEQHLFFLPFDPNIS